MHFRSDRVDHLFRRKDREDPIHDGAQKGGVLPFRPDKLQDPAIDAQPRSPSLRFFPGVGSSQLLAVEELTNRNTSLRKRSGIGGLDIPEELIPQIRPKPFGYCSQQILSARYDLHIRALGRL